MNHRIPTLAEEQQTHHDMAMVRKAKVVWDAASPGRVLFSKGTMAISLPPYPKQAAQGKGINPFSVYQQPVLSNAVSINVAGNGYTVGDVLDVLGGTLAADGVPAQITVGLVDLAGKVLWGTVTQKGGYTTPPDWPASVSGGTGAGAQVTVLSGADNWRCFQIRSGTVGTRPKWAIDSGKYQDLLETDIINPLNAPGGSPELVIGVDCDGNLTSSTVPASPGSGGVVTVPANGNGSVLIYGYLGDGPAGEASTFAQYGQIILDNSQFNSDTKQYETACMFWLEIIDDPETLKGFYVNLMAQTCGYGLDWVYDVPFPTGANIIPLAVVQTVNVNLPGQDAIGIVWQIQSGNATNRWAGMAGGSVQTLRGRWTADNLSGQFFYPGDVIIDDSNPYTLEDSLGHAIATYQFNWVYTGTAGTVTNTPFDSAVNWTQLCSTINP
jgi:hypothetical protein